MEKVRNRGRYQWETSRQKLSPRDTWHGCRSDGKDVKLMAGYCSRWFVGGGESEGIWEFTSVTKPNFYSPPGNSIDIDLGTEK